VNARCCARVGNRGKSLFCSHASRHMDFQKSAVVIAGKELVCVDKFCRPLVGGVQVVRDCTVPGKSQATLRCRVNCREIAGLGVVEGMHGKIQLANSLNQLDCQGKLLVQ